MTADDIATFQAGTHPGLTAPPLSYRLVNGAEAALAAARKESAVSQAPAVPESARV